MVVGEQVVEHLPERVRMVNQRLAAPVTYAKKALSPLIKHVRAFPRPP